MEGTVIMPEEIGAIIVAIFIIGCALAPFVIAFFYGRKNKVYGPSFGEYLYQQRQNQNQDKSQSVYDNNIGWIATYEELKDFLVKSYFDLVNDIQINAGFIISAEKLIELFQNKKVFIFNNQFNVKTQAYQNSTSIHITIIYTQGYKVFRALLVNPLESKLSNQDLQVLSKIKTIFINIVNTDMTPFEKELAVHDYLVKTSRYDYENYKKDTIPQDSYNPYGLLFKNTAVCSAYAETFMIFMTLAGIECHFVIGKTIDQRGNTYKFEEKNTGHAWNIVKINGHYYHVDVTFDNPVPDVIGKVEHTYFNVTDEFMDKTHDWALCNYPICDSVEYSYYNGLKKIQAQRY